MKKELTNSEKEVQLLNETELKNIDGGGDYILIKPIHPFPLPFPRPLPLPLPLPIFLD